jgi:2-polyprenyl-3-methyl-5-hydroxy-6-metoxy-1,4-benzoquinol methylase
MSTHTAEITRHERFSFGKNWRHFLATLNEDRIASALNSLQQMLEVQDLNGRTFLDIGSGSGLFSLAARRLGAVVHSVDYDPESVACTAELKNRYYREDAGWVVEEGSILDDELVSQLPRSDVVYSWGVLHHTGKMRDALENVASLVAPEGQLFIAIYNDCGSKSERWHAIKKVYNRLPRFFRVPYTLMVSFPSEFKLAARAVLHRRPSEYIRSWTHYTQQRGMSHWYDIVDWVGGYPYEYASPEEIFDFFRARGFVLIRLKCGGVGLGCNEFVFRRED